MSGCTGRPKPSKPRRPPPADKGNEVACAHCRCRMVGHGGKPWTFTCGACGKPVCDDCEQSDGCPGTVVVTHTFTCSPCRGCGDPYYIDGCLGCGYGIDGNFGNERCD